jgi:hypothetical protein
MTFEQKLQQLKTKMFDLISVKEITFLKDLDYRITINKNGKFCYYNCLELDSSNISKFLCKLEDNKVYSLIPFISANDKSDEPYIILSQSILITNKSNPLLISRYIYNKCIDTMKLYNIAELKDFNVIFKYKSVEIDFEAKNKFV